MIVYLVWLWGSINTLLFTSTCVLIFFGESWRSIPHWYLHVLALIQRCYPAPEDKNKNNAPELSDVQVELTADQIAEQKVKRIIDEDLGPCFVTEPTSRETLLGWRHKKDWNWAQCTGFYVGFFFRVFFLLPTRLLLLATSFVFVALAGLQTAVRKLSDREKTWVAIVYCRLFCGSMGLVANYRNPQNRPKKPGVAVSNHLTPNDIQILFAGTPHGSTYGYVVTGQKHSGIIGAIEYLVEKLCPSIWLDRRCVNERQGFLAEILKIAKREGPVLLFPEGYCSNNSQVLQFRKAIFEDNVNIYPISIKQSPEFGDGFWYEDEFFWYLFRTMLNWANVYDIQYLPMETKRESENNTMFASRVQRIIAKSAGVPSCEYGGTLWYKQEERQKLKEAFKAQMENASEKSGNADKLVNETTNVPVRT